MEPKFKPGGKRFPPKSTSKSLPPQISNLSSDSTSNSPTSSGLDQEAENKFELELCWCIQQLELGINNGNFSEKQMKSTQKNLDLLKNNNTSLIHKRQIMRTTFGDYRMKMLQEEKKHSKSVSTVKFSKPKPFGNKSIFIRKAQSTSSNIDQSTSDQCDDIKIVNSNEASVPKLSSLFDKNTPSKPFTFNFNQSNE
ncbi:hypothetical protein PV327_002462 [Microctonus hyperodae]|uniref:Uncharacterized protein n=1 Tax=Microctonus hyperodae TaxID=165561 RepID=A0AA39KPC9_MICHY|nr:hypothetical protein PV327_002462 [Microctonus hyperodae]